MPGKQKRAGKFRRMALDFDEDQVAFIKEYASRTYRTQSDVIRYAVFKLKEEVNG